MEKKISRDKLFKIICGNITNLFVSEEGAIKCLNKIKEELDEYELGIYFEEFCINNQIISKMMDNDTYSSYGRLEKLNFLIEKIYYGLLSKSHIEEHYSNDEVKEVVNSFFCTLKGVPLTVIPSSHFNVLYNCFGLGGISVQASDYFKSIKVSLFNEINPDMIFKEFLITDIRDKLRKQANQRLSNKEVKLETQEMSIDEKINIIKVKVSKLEELAKQEKKLKSNLDSIKVQQQQLLDEINALKL